MTPEEHQAITEAVPPPPETAEGKCKPKAVPLKAREATTPHWKEEAMEPGPFITPCDSYPERAVKKLGRGVANMVTSPLEIINQPVNSINRQQTDGVIANTTAAVTGVAVGVGWTIWRLLAGAFDVVTFFAPPHKPVIDPEFVTNDFQKRSVFQIKSREEMKERLAIDRYDEMKQSLGIETD